MVYPVTNTRAQATSAAVKKWIHQFGFSHSVIRDRGTTFPNTDFVNWTKELGNTLRPRTAPSPCTNGKVETQNEHIARYWRSFLNDAGFNWASVALNLRSRIIPALITLVVKRLTKPASAPNHKSRRLSNLESIATNKNYIVMDFVQTCLLILNTRTLRRMSFFRTHSVRNFLRLR